MTKDGGDISKYATKCSEEISVAEITTQYFEHIVQVVPAWLLMEFLQGKILVIDRISYWVTNNFHTSYLLIEYLLNILLFSHILTFLYWVTY